MRDQGLQEAIRAVGGISALARRLGVAQPSISAWTKVPAERVLAVEAVTEVPRGVLRPDLYPADGGVELDPIDATRSQLYLLLSHLVLDVPGETLLVELKSLTGDADSALGQAMGELARRANVVEVDPIAREHFNLFIGVGRGELLPYASFYRTGFLYERPLVRARQDLRRLGLERGEGRSEPEDHIGFLLETMASLAARRVTVEPGEEARFFRRHLEPWAERFFDDLIKAENAKFYRAVGQVGLEFMKIEREAFALETDTAAESLADTEEGGRA